MRGGRSNSIRALGIAVVLDDFGVGYSSIGYLRSFAFDKLKLDRSLIADIDRDPHAQKLVQATVALADALELQLSPRKASRPRRRRRSCGSPAATHFRASSSAARHAGRRNDGVARAPSALLEPRPLRLA